MKKSILLLTIILLSTSAFSQNAVELNKQGIELAKKGKIDKAFELFEKAIEINPDFIGAYSNRGNIYRMQKKYSLAIRDYTKSIQLDPSDFDIIYARANTYLDAEDFLNAIIDYSTIIDKNPSFPDIYFDRGYANIRLENYEKAKEDMESQIILAPKDFKSLANLINIKKKLELYDEAFADYDKILKEFPNQPNLHIVYNNRSSLFQIIDKYEKALEDINIALKINENYDIGLFNRAGIYMKLGDKKKACQDFKKSLKLGLESNDHFKDDDVFKDFEKTL